MGLRIGIAGWKEWENMRPSQPLEVSGSRDEGWAYDPGEGGGLGGGTL